MPAPTISFPSNNGVPVADGASSNTITITIIIPDDGSVTSLAGASSWTPPGAFQGAGASDTDAPYLVFLKAELDSGTTEDWALSAEGLSVSKGWKLGSWSQSALGTTTQWVYVYPSADIDNLEPGQTLSVDLNGVVIESASGDSPVLNYEVVYSGSATFEGPYSGQSKVADGLSTSPAPQLAVQFDGLGSGVDPSYIWVGDSGDHTNTLAIQIFNDTGSDLSLSTDTQITIEPIYADASSGSSAALCQTSQIDNTLDLQVLDVNGASLEGWTANVRASAQYPQIVFEPSEAMTLANQESIVLSISGVVSNQPVGQTVVHVDIDGLATGSGDPYAEAVWSLLVTKSDMIEILSFDAVWATAGVTDPADVGQPWRVPLLGPVIDADNDDDWSAGTIEESEVTFFWTTNVPPGLPAPTIEELEPNDETGAQRGRRVSPAVPAADGVPTPPWRQGFDGAGTLELKVNFNGRSANTSITAGAYTLQTLWTEPPWAQYLATRNTMDLVRAGNLLFVLLVGLPVVYWYDTSDGSTGTIEFEDPDSHAASTKTCDAIEADSTGDYVYIAITDMSAGPTDPKPAIVYQYAVRDLVAGKVEPAAVQYNQAGASVVSLCADPEQTGVYILHYTADETTRKWTGMAIDGRYFSTNPEPIAVSTWSDGIRPPHYHTMLAYVTGAQSPTGKPRFYCLSTDGGVDYYEDGDWTTSMTTNLSGGLPGRPVATGSSWLCAGTSEGKFPVAFEFGAGSPTLTSLEPEGEKWLGANWGQDDVENNNRGYQQSLAVVEASNRDNTTIPWLVVGSVVKTGASDQNYGGHNYTQWGLIAQPIGEQGSVGNTWTGSTNMVKSSHGVLSAGRFALSDDRKILYAAVGWTNGSTTAPSSGGGILEFTFATGD